MSDELKPCPFCGSTNISQRPYNNEMGDVGMVKCNNCLVLSSYRGWNARHTPEAVKTNETQTLTTLKRLVEAAQSEPTGPEGFSDNMIAAMQNANKVIEEGE